MVWNNGVSEDEKEQVGILNFLYIIYHIVTYGVAEFLTETRVKVEQKD